MIALERRYVAAMRAAGASWAQIAASLGIGVKNLAARTQEVSPNTRDAAMIEAESEARGLVSLVAEEPHAVDQITAYFLVMREFLRLRAEGTLDTGADVRAGLLVARADLPAAPPLAQLPVIRASNDNTSEELTALAVRSLTGLIAEVGPGQQMALLKGVLAAGVGLLAAINPEVAAASLDNLSVAARQMVSLHRLPPPRGEAVIASVAARHGLAPAVLTGQRRDKVAARARQEVVWELRQIKTPDGQHKWSYPAIGKLLGGRDHTTALHSYNRHCQVHGLASETNVAAAGGAA